MDKPGLTTVLLPFVLCLPCLLVVLGAAGGVALVAGVVASLAGNATIAAVVGGASATALIAAAMRKRKSISAACEISATGLENRVAPRH